jgi:cysteine desulfuration protein SufE
MLDSLPGRSERIQLLIDLADRWKPVPESIATRPYSKAHRTPACESEVYVFAEPLESGTLKYHFAVENPQGISAMAMAAILDHSLSGEPIEHGLAVKSDLVLEIFGRELSMGKSMGLMGMVSMVHHCAKRALAGNPSPPYQDRPCDRA